MRLVIVAERAERLIPELMMPLTRLAELVTREFAVAVLSSPDLPVNRPNSSVVFVSEAPRVTIRPPLGASPHSYFFDVPPLTKEGMSPRKKNFFKITRSISRRSQALDLEVLFSPTPQTPLHALYHYPLRCLLPIHP